MSKRWRLIVGLYALLLSALVVTASVIGTAHAFSFVLWLPYGDKLGHFLVCGSLSLLWDLGQEQRNTRLLGLTVPFAPALVVLIATLEELSQNLFPLTRTFDLLDLAANLSGAVCLPLLVRAAFGRRSLLALQTSA